MFSCNMTCQAVLTSAATMYTLLELKPVVFVSKYYCHFSLLKYILNGVHIEN